MLLKDDENHIMKTALEFYAMMCKKFSHPKLAEKCTQMSSKITCDPTTNCNHNIETTVE